MNKKLGIGIDTGGTYTDAVIYDFDENKLIASAKSLTTRQDLSIGILGALSALPGDSLKQARLISLSTTLATNACVENRGGRVKLVFLGGDERVINELGAGYGLPPAKDIYIQECFSDFSGNIQREPDWEFYRKSIRENFSSLDGAAIVEIYAMKNNAVLEKKAKSIFEEEFSIPVVCGHELFSGLNCLQRASGALLDAGLFPVIREFLEAIKKAMTEREIEGRTVIVRSDGSLMSDEYAATHPVETLLCGPAATVSGGIFLSGEKDCIIVDMGGTTTDIAIVKNDNPVMAVDGISAGKWKTFVKGFAVRTFGLGGDSAIHYNDDAPFLEEYRVVPLCVTAAKNPVLIEKLRDLAESHIKHSHFLHEFYILNTGLRDSSRYTDNEKKFCGLLEKGPLVLKEAAEAMDTDVYNLKFERLLNEGIVQVSGFTPTDIMHITGDFSAFSTEASLLAARHIAFNLGISVERLCRLVYDDVKRRLYFNIAMTLLENSDLYIDKKAGREGVKYFIDRSYRCAKEGNTRGLLGFDFHTAFPLVGLGAPIRIFLDDVAALFGTRAVIPDHYEVANAIGAVAGKIRSSYEVEIRPNYSRDGVTGYMVYGFNRNETFRKLSDAEMFAAAEAESGARSDIVSRGGRGDPEVLCENKKHEGAARHGSVYMGSTVIARAAASPG